MAGRLGLDGAVGTTNVLIGKVSLADALQQYADTGLQVLTCGPIPPNPSELLQSHAMETLLADLRRDFDVIIIDAPPLLPVTDAALLAAQADGAVVVVRHGRTTRDQLSTRSSGSRRWTPRPWAWSSTWRRAARTARATGTATGTATASSPSRRSTASARGARRRPR